MWKITSAIFHFLFVPYKTIPTRSSHISNIISPVGSWLPYWAVQVLMPWDFIISQKVVEPMLIIKMYLFSKTHGCEWVQEEKGQIWLKSVKSNAPHLLQVHKAESLRSSLGCRHSCLQPPGFLLCKDPKVRIALGETCLKTPLWNVLICLKYFCWPGNLREKTLCYIFFVLLFFFLMLGAVLAEKIHQIFDTDY